MDPKAYWIGFNKIRGIGAVRTRKLLYYFGDLGSAWQADYENLKKAGLPLGIIDSFLEIRSQTDLQFELERINSLQIKCLTIQDEAYPQRLKTIEHPPPVLYVRGELSREDEYAVAVVGTRHKSAYGKQVAAELSQFLVKSGISIVSGMARGIDSVAHEAALDAGGRTLAVMGCGVDIIYPPEHRSLAERIMANGALISDYFPGTQPEGINFPPRNRIISGISMATVVVEAGEKSGALITAEFAALQGREVFAVPGSIFAPHSKGTNRLVQDGAIPLTNFEDILTALNLDKITEFRYAKSQLPENEIESLLVEIMKNEAMHINDIKSATDLSMEKVSAALVMMELKGMVKQVGSMVYIAVADQQGLYEV